MGRGSTCRRFSKILARLRRGERVYCETYGSQCARNDIPADFLPPEMVRKAGIKYVLNVGEAVSLREQEFSKVAKELHKPLMQ
jgi:hypothetical protein